MPFVKGNTIGAEARFETRPSGNCLTTLPCSKNLDSHR